MPILKTATGKEVLFVHIPKTGGQTIERIFFLDELDFYSDLAHSKFYGWSKNRDLEYTHLTLNEIIAFHPDRIKPMDKFAIVRNPYDRIVSEYLFWKRVGCDRLFDYDIKHISFNQYVAEIYRNWDKIISGQETIFIQAIKNGSTSTTTKENHQFNRCHYLPQSHFITPENISEFSETLTLLRFEDYASQLWNYLINDCQHSLKAIPHINSNNRNPEAEQYHNFETKALVAEMYKKDFELFNYQT